MRIIPFGTASGRPTSTRNVSGVAVDLDGRWVLVDCGEGTQQQVMRSPLRLSRLSAILITHLHGDHVLGLPGLIGTMSMESRTAPLTLVGPTGLAEWLAVMTSLPILGYDFDVMLTELTDDTLTGVGDSPIGVAQVGRVSISALAIRHRVPCFGYRFEEADRPGRLDPERAAALGVSDQRDLGKLAAGHTVVGATGNTIEPHEVVGPIRRGRVVTVLGDTTPCQASIVLARHADVLVHEATYRTADEALGEQWKHSSSRQAAQTAADADARHLVLTHFSSRYDKLDGMLAEAVEVFESTELALEGQEIPVP